MKKFSETITTGLEKWFSRALRWGRSKSEVSAEAFIAGLHENAFCAHYQPIVRAATDECIGVEALARWRLGHSHLLPESFIPTALDAHLMIELSRYILQRVAEDFKQFALPPHFIVSVNIPAEYLTMPALLEDCHELLAILQSKQARLVLEVPATLPLPEELEAQLVTEGLRQLGIKLALDNYLATTANPYHLLKWAFDYLKVEKDYISSWGQPGFQDNSLDILLSSAQKLGAELIIKGVENQGQHHYLSKRGVPYLQGFYFSKPMTRNHFRKWLYSGIIEDKPTNQK
ncbi:EAL domain-containing protein [Neisseriaceae bacterium TC5R-5]|nr:EAL domain-containing protein [Neisseriaceae bacterium TC5R-5]